jgi:hypothetical protein
LKRFWEIENCEMPKPERNKSKKSVKRQTDGRYVVTLPLKPTMSQRVDSKQGALHRFYSVKRRFAKDPAVTAVNSVFIDEYEKLDHMSPTTSSTISPIASSSANIDNTAVTG